MEVVKAMSGTHIFMFLNKMEKSTVRKIFQGKVLKQITLKIFLFSDIQTILKCHIYFSINNNI